MNTYEQKQEARRERLLERADKMRAKARARSKAGWDALHAIPFGQPILIGHHSEKRDRNYRARACGNIDKAVELDRTAGELEARADSVGRGGISSDDPDAPAKIRERIAELEEKHAAIKTRPHGSWELSNSSANIRRLKQRLARLEHNAMRETTETEVNGVRIVENAEENRLQIFFPGKPSAETRAKLKRQGFRWARSVGAWQRHLSAQARWAAEFVLQD